MKIRFCAALLLAAFCATLFAGCTAANALNQSPAAPEITIATNPLPRSAAPVPTDAPASADVPVPTPAATPAATGSTRPGPEYISRETVKSIALAHAGLSETDVTRLRVEFDYDDGRAEYEVDFHHGSYEYDYEIDAVSGKILSWDEDFDD
ncbi:MAG: PepSY domain-containing protein [Oscillospiraceae bacterium]|nr:PepSY domain-containing protein [Oscillospiraceae bacterium]